jgi:hypothetical protein
VGGLAVQVHSDVDLTGPPSCRLSLVLSGRYAVRL